MSRERRGPVGGREHRAEGDLTRSRPARPRNNVTYVTVVEDDSNDDWVTFAAVAGYTGMMTAWGCAVWGSAGLLSALHRIRRLLPDLLPALPHLRRGRLGITRGAGTYGRSAVAVRAVRRRGSDRTRATSLSGTHTRGAAALRSLRARALPRPITRAPAPYAQPRARAPTSTATGARATSSAVTTGRGRGTSPTAGPARRRAGYARTKAARFAAAGRAWQRFCRGQWRQRLRGPRRQRSTSVVTTAPGRSARERRMEQYQPSRSVDVGPARSRSRAARAERRHAHSRTTATTAAASGAQRGHLPIRRRLPRRRRGGGGAGAEPATLRGHRTWPGHDAGDGSTH